MTSPFDTTAKDFTDAIHKIADLEHKLALAEKVIEAAREISCGNHVNCKEHGYAALYTAIKELDVANG